MPIKLRRTKGRRRRDDQIPVAARWWLEHGCTADSGDAAARLIVSAAMHYRADLPWEASHRLVVTQRGHWGGDPTT
jgi:hypothetical protein